jgi:large subunit ribosomal protein L21
VYAIVKAGARQERVSVGEILDIDRVEASVGATVALPLLLLVEGGKILEEVKGPKIDILRYKSKTGYRRRQGFRAKKTRIKVTAINSK